MAPTVGLATSAHIVTCRLSSRFTRLLQAVKLDVLRHRYALMLFCMGVGALLANGASGPLAALLTLLLPPEIKSFALSVHEFATYLIGPMFGVIMGVGLQVGLQVTIYTKS